MTCTAVTSCNKISMSCCNKVLNLDELQQNKKLWQGAMFNKLQQRAMTSNKLWL
jgi:hypothetical protein